MDHDFFYKCQEVTNINISFSRVINLIKSRKIEILRNELPFEDLHVTFADFIHQEMEIRWREFFKKYTIEKDKPGFDFNTELAVVLNCKGFFTLNDIKRYLTKYLDKDSPGLNHEKLVQLKQDAENGVIYLYHSLLEYLSLTRSIASILINFFNDAKKTLHKPTERLSYMTRSDVEELELKRTEILKNVSEYNKVENIFQELEKETTELIATIQNYLQNDLFQKSVRNEFASIQEKMKSANEEMKNDNIVALLKFLNSREVVESYLSMLQKEVTLLEEVKRQEKNLTEKLEFYEKHKKNLETYENTVTFFETSVVLEYNTCLKLLIFNITPLKNMRKVMV